MSHLVSELPHMSHLGSELLAVLPLGMELLLPVSHPGSEQHSAGGRLVCAVSSPLELAQMCLDDIHLHFCASLHGALFVLSVLCQQPPPFFMLTLVTHLSSPYCLSLEEEL